MRLLIVGTLNGHMQEAGKIALSQGAKVSHAETVDQGLHALRSGAGIDLVMIDVELDVATMIASMEQERMATALVACGVQSDAKAAVRAIKAGAKEYVPLPPDAELIAAILKAVADEDYRLIAEDPAMKRVLAFADQVAPSDASVLITGDSGTGKEVMARYVHRQSKRAEKPFVSLNCAAIPENLLESELFGHEKGAFSGAVARRIGKFEEANGGTLLLDEISEMDLRLQAKLLRAIQEREIDRVGGTAPVKVDIRIIATSNRDLEQTVREGNFREDLYFRLNVINLELPALRERPADIGPLAAFFVRKYADLNGVPLRPLTQEAQDKLYRHHWRGNVRELENTMHRAVLVSTGNQIGPEAIILSGETLAPVSITGGAATTIGYERSAEGHSDSENSGKLVGRTVAEVERDLILDTLNHCLGNRTHAANILGISIRTLRNKLRQYADDGVEVPAPKAGEPLAAAG